MAAMTSRTNSGKRMFPSLLLVDMQAVRAGILFITGYSEEFLKIRAIPNALFSLMVVLFKKHRREVFPWGAYSGIAPIPAVP